MPVASYAARSRGPDPDCSVCYLPLLSAGVSPAWWSFHTYCCLLCPSLILLIAFALPDCCRLSCLWLVQRAAPASPNVCYLTCFSVLIKGWRQPATSMWIVRGVIDPAIIVDRSKPVWIDELPHGRPVSGSVHTTGIRDGIPPDYSRSCVSWAVPRTSNKGAHTPLRRG